MEGMWSPDERDNTVKSRSQTKDGRKRPSSTQEGVNRRRQHTAKSKGNHAAGQDAMAAVSVRGGRREKCGKDGHAREGIEEEQGGERWLRIYGVGGRVLPRHLESAGAAAL